jgi:hypothetical protein
MMFKLSSFGGSKIRSCLMTSIRSDADWPTAPPEFISNFRTNVSNWYCDRRVYDLMLVNFNKKACPRVNRT